MANMNMYHTQTYVVCCSVISSEIIVLSSQIWVLQMKEFWCYEAKIEESEKALNPGQLWLDLPVLCHWVITAGQPPSSKCTAFYYFPAQALGASLHLAFYVWVQHNPNSVTILASTLCPTLTNLVNVYSSLPSYNPTLASFSNLPTTQCLQYAKTYCRTGFYCVV